MSSSSPSQLSSRTSTRCQDVGAQPVFCATHSVTLVACGVGGGEIGELSRGRHGVTVDEGVLMGHKEPEPGAGAGATQDRKHLKLFSERLAGRAGGRKLLVPWEWAMKGGTEQAELEAPPQTPGPPPTPSPFADSIWQKEAP